jgi:alpha-tubulin suppressor-like RCC1 family protein
MNNEKISKIMPFLLVLTLLGMSLSAMPMAEESVELDEQKTQLMTHGNVSNLNVAGYQEDSIYTYSTISGGGYTQCIITESETVACFGSNEHGKRGINNEYRDWSYIEPAGQAGLWAVEGLPSTPMVEITTGAQSTCSLSSLGKIWCWGGNLYGQLGLGYDSCFSQNNNACNNGSNFPPMEVALPNGTTAVSLSDANQWHFCAILNTGQGLCWGANDHGQLGDGTICTGGSGWAPDNNPSPGCSPYNGRFNPIIVGQGQLPSNTSFISISTGFQHTCGILDTNDLYCWGRNNGALGLGSTGLNIPDPTFVDSDVVAVGTGDEHTCALYLDKTVSCWGVNEFGQLGTSNNYQSTVPVAINLSSNISLISLEVAYDNNCAIDDTFEVYCWGRNNYGQTGSAPLTDVNGGQTTPLQAFPNSTVTYSPSSLSINGESICWMLANESLACGGNNYRGMTGNGVYGDAYSYTSAIIVNLSIGNYSGLPGIHISERDHDEDSIISIYDELPYGCSSGYYDPTYNDSCTMTSPGYYTPDFGYHSEIACDLGTYQPNSGQSSCINSTPGHFVNITGASIQEACLPGTYQPNYSEVSCIETSPGYGTNLESTGQEICSIGYYQPIFGGDICIPSSPGSYTPNTGAMNQIDCASGTYQPNYASSSCIDAFMGNYVANSNSISQEGCSPGNYQPDTGQTSCIDANPGNFVTDHNSIIQTACNLGTYHNITGSTQESDCQSSDPGHYVDSFGASSQTECPAGSYNPNTGSLSSSDCLFADSGHFVADSGSPAQTPCDLGYYQPFSGQLFCLESASGSYVSEIGSSSVTYCTEGNYQPESSQSECIDADEGFYVQTPRSSSQTPCLAGSYQSETGTTSCILADIGYHVPLEGQSMQTMCPAGQYQPQPASSECLTTNPGSYSSVGSTSPSPCLAGSYQGQSGQSGCALADPGYFVSSIASTEQIACSEGQYQSLTGQESCVSADRGHYVDSDAAQEQTPCSAGSYQPLMASTACILTSENYFVDSPGQSSQTLCPKGESQPDSGQISCILDTKESGNTMVIIGSVAVVAILTGGVLFTVKNNNSKVPKGRKSTKSTRTRKRAPPKED